MDRVGVENDLSSSISARCIHDGEMICGEKRTAVSVAGNKQTMETAETERVVAVRAP